MNNNSYTGTYLIPNPNAMTKNEKNKKLPGILVGEDKFRMVTVKSKLEEFKDGYIVEYDNSEYVGIISDNIFYKAIYNSELKVNDIKDSFQALLKNTRTHQTPPSSESFDEKVDWFNIKGGPALDGPKAEQTVKGGDLKNFLKGKIVEAKALNYSKVLVVNANCVEIKAFVIGQDDTVFGGIDKEGYFIPGKYPVVNNCTDLSKIKVVKIT